MENFTTPPQKARRLYKARTLAFVSLLLALLLTLLACTPPGDEEPKAWPMRIQISPVSAGSALGSGTSIRLVFEREIRELKLKNTKNEPLVALTIWRTSQVSGKSAIDIVALRIKQSNIDNTDAKIVTLGNIEVPPITATKKGLSSTVVAETARLQAKFPVDGSGNLTLQKNDVLALSLAASAVTDTNGNQNSKEAIRRFIVE